MNKVTFGERLAMYSIWNKIHREAGVSSSLIEFLKLCRCYGAEDRAYHTLVHIRECLKYVNVYFSSEPSINLVRMAILYHDVVYDAKSKDNEAQSAALARAHMTGAGFTKEAIDKVEHLILITASHLVAADSDRLDKIMIDIDMGILTRSWPVYLDYAKGVWREYQFAGREAYVAGRLAFLRSVDVDGVFSTPELRKWIWLAKRNIGRETGLLLLTPEVITG